MRTESEWLKRALKKIRESRSLIELFNVYERQRHLILEHGSPGEGHKVWQAYYSHIWNV